MNPTSPLHGWLNRQLAAGLPAIAGARVAGTVPLQVGLVNELLASLLAEARDAASPRQGGGPGLPVDVATLARLVRHVRVDAGPGVITLDFEIGVDG